MSQQAEGGPSRSRRILMCIPSMSGGGAERQFSYLCVELVKLGWKVTAALLDLGPNAERLLKTGVDIKILAHSSNYDPRIVWQLMGLIRSQKPDIVHTWLPTMNTLGGIAAGLTSALLVGSERNSRPECKEPWKDRLQMRVLSTWADAVIANSAAGQAYLDASLNKRVAKFVVSNGLPLAEMDAVAPCSRPEVGIAPDAQVILFAGRLEAHKNLAVLFSALSKVLITNPKAVAVICGKGSKQEQWQQWVSQNGLGGRVHFAGYVNNLSAWLKSADVFFFPSTYEGQPNVVLEAMACGCPLVVSDIPEHREFLDETSALFAPADNAEKFAGAIQAVFSSPQLAAQRAANARNIIAQYSIENMARVYNRIYCNLLETKTNGSKVNISEQENAKQ